MKSRFCFVKGWSVCRRVKLAPGLSQNDGWASEKVCMRCESVVNMTGPSALTASSQPLAAICCQDVSRAGPTAARDQQ